MYDRMNMCKYTHFPSLLDHQHQHSDKHFVSPVKKANLLSITFSPSSFYLSSWLPFTAELLKRLNLYTFSQVSLLLLRPKSILIHFGPTQTLLINIATDLGLDKSISSMKYNWCASSWNMFLLLASWTSHSAFLLSIAAPSQPAGFFLIVFTSNGGRIPGLHPIPFFPTFTSVRVSSELTALNTIDFPMSVYFVSPAQICSVISYSYIQLFA